MKWMKAFKNWLRAGKRALKRLPPVVIPGVFVLRVLRGWYAYRRILRSCPMEEGWRVWFMDYDGSGDTYLSCGYLRSRGLLGPKDAFAGSGGPAMRVARLFGFGRYAQVKPGAALCVRFMERFYGRPLELQPLLYESEYLEYSGLFRHFAGWRGLDFMAMLKIGLEANCGVPYEEGPWQQPEFPYDGAELDRLFAENGLLPGRTALLAPYAGKSDLWGVPMSFYEDLAGRLKEAGYTVCTNSGGGPKEPPVPGTVPLLVPYRLIRPFCERAGVFIGLRSGLCDMISAANCRKVVLYTGLEIPSVTASHREFFSLNNMGLCEDAVEVEITGENRETIAEMTINLIIKG